MAVQQIDFSTIQTIIKEGVDITKLMLDGARRWERYVVQEIYQVWVESGHNQTVTEDSGWKFNPNPYSRSPYYWSVQWDGPGLLFGSYRTSSNYRSPHYNSGYTYYKGSLVKTVQEESSRTYYYRVKRTRPVTQWVDTSHYEDRTRDKTVYFY